MWAIPVTLAIIIGAGLAGLALSRGGSESADPAPTPVPTVAAAPTAAAAAPATSDPTLRAHSTGAFEVAVPDASWVTASRFLQGDPAQPAISARPQLHPAEGAMIPRFRTIVVDAASPTAFLDGLPPSSVDCTSSRQRSNRMVGSVTVIVSLSTGCADGLDTFLGVWSASNGDVVVADIRDVPGRDWLPAIDRAVETYGPGTTAATLAALYPCSGTTVDPAGTRIQLINYSGGEITMTGTLANGGPIPDGPISVGGGGFAVVAPNSTITITTDAGVATHVSTAGPVDCVMATPDSLEHLRPPG